MFFDNRSSSGATATIDVDTTLASRGSHEHFTLKEIHEQPEALQRVMRGRIDHRFNTARFGGLNLEPRELMAFKRIKLLGCGSACIAASIGAGMIERLARLPADAESAAEFRYRNPIIDPETLYFAVSQSGETYDTLAAVQEIQRKGGTVLGVVNVVGSTIARQCSAGIYLHAGPEVAVVSTKTFACTLLAFALFARAIYQLLHLVWQLLPRVDDPPTLSRRNIAHSTQVEGEQSKRQQRAGERFGGHHRHLGSGMKIYAGPFRPSVTERPTAQNNSA